MRRVLLISPHFPPDSSAASHRVRLLAPHLPEWGWAPTVLTVVPEAYEGELDPDLLALVPPDLLVLRTGAWPASTTRRFGIGDLGLRAMTALSREAHRQLSTGRFDLVFVTTYPVYPALLGPGLRRRYRVPFVLDLQDPWVGAWGRDVGGGPGGRPDWRSRVSRLAARWMERRVVRAADGLTAVSERTYVDVLTRVPDAAPVVCAELPLGFEVADLDFLIRHPRAVRLFDPSDGNTHLVCVGTVLPTGLDVVRALLAGVARLRSGRPEVANRLRLHFVGSSNQRLPGQRPRVTPLAEQFGVGDLVHEVPERVDYLEALNLQLQAGGLLLLGSREPHYTPSKAYPAYLSGRPILGLYHRESSVVSFLRNCPSADLITFPDQVDPDALAAPVAAALETLARRAVSPGPGLRMVDAGAEWSSRAIARRLAQVFTTVSGAFGSGGRE